MALVPYDPFAWLRKDGALPSLGQLLDSDWFRWSGMGNVPRVDVRETPSEVIVTAEIPGLERKEDVDITVHENHLHLNGEIRRGYEENRDNLHRSERYYGRFARTIPLPAPVEHTGAKATYHNGVLEIRLHKTRELTGRRIDVDFH
ncbi:MAG: Hsp20/alpha crystallin family protein [Alicyclobacillus sp.]|nr:Hsp20/alpha crystallin family protein [Alicyclobacillus sp.]